MHRAPGTEVFSDAHIVALHIICAEHYVERFTVTPCSERLVTTVSQNCCFKGNIGETPLRYGVERIIIMGLLERIDTILN